MPRKSRRRTLIDLSRKLIDAQRPVRVLALIAWPTGERNRFLSRKQPRLPKVRYARPRFDLRAHDATFAAIARNCDRADPLQLILRDTAEQYRRVLAMLEARGTRDYTRHSRALYGTAGAPFLGGPKTNLDLANHLLSSLDGQALDRLRRQTPRVWPAERVVRTLSQRFDRFFGRGAVRVQISTTLTADAAAGASRLRIRRDGEFTRQTVDYLEQHEGYVHIATSLNGSAQPVLDILGKASPRSVKHNEGLAVFGEWASGTLTAARLRSLAERVQLVHLAEEGADFIDLYQHALSLGRSPERAYDAAHRVFRGGLPEGGAYFTKDSAYLDHFMRTFDFFRASALHGRLDLFELLFAGKVAIDDLPALAQARLEGLIAPARFVPPWLASPDWLAAHLGLSSFFNQIDLSAVRAHYADLFATAPAPADEESSGAAFGG
ncbi:MAG: flavohemoglobin expression-modulating QEGLA motif protein [Myxococcales bacterium]|nr:flavohemoglobin expression-modulating QEGLA motif protein [Myxococcales bacterium]